MLRLKLPPLDYVHEALDMGFDLAGHKAGKSPSSRSERLSEEVEAIRQVQNQQPVRLAQGAPQRGQIKTLQYDSRCWECKGAMSAGDRYRLRRNHTGGLSVAHISCPG